MVCVTITRDPLQIDDNLAREIRDSFHDAIVRLVNVEPHNVELRVRDIGPLDVNTPPLAVDIDSGPGKESWRVEACARLLLEIDNFVLPMIPDKFQAKGESNMWIRIFAKGASMPIGCPELIH